MSNFISRLVPSDYIQLIGVVISLISSISAIIISVATLRQNSKMIKESTRPYIGIYGLSTYLGFRQYYIILKNFGQSGAIIDSITYSFDISELSKHKDFEPFSHLDGVTIMPGQSYRSAIDFDKVQERNLEYIYFHLVYHFGSDKYEEEICLKIDGNLGNLEAHAKYKRSEQTTAIGVIAETLQDMHIKSL